MSLNNIEKLRTKIEQRRLCVGTTVSFADPAISELVGEVGYDFTWIEMEHAALNLQNVLGHILAVRGTETAPWVRVPWNDPVLMKPVLDLEPAGIIVPMVRSGKEAAAAVAACRFPPTGIRSFGPWRGVSYGGRSAADFIREAGQQPMVIIQAEHIDAVNDIDAIAATPGLDGICLGPCDLSASMGKLGHTSDPEVLAAMDRIIATTRSHGKMIGVSFGYARKAVEYWLSKDLTFMAVGTDFLNLFAQSKTVFDHVRGSCGN